MDALERRRPVGDAVHASAAIAGPPAAAGLPSGAAELAWIEVGLQDELELDGGELESVAGELG